MQALTAQGPVIVEPKNKTVPMDYDEDIVMMISDDYHASALEPNECPADGSLGYGCQDYLWTAQ